MKLFVIALLVVFLWPQFGVASSSDGTKLAAPSVGVLVDATGARWSWGTVRQGANYAIRRNGFRVGWGVLIEVAKQGHFFDKNATGTWTQWASGHWIPATDPNSAPPPKQTNALLGMYQGDGLSPPFHVQFGRYPDFTIDYSYMGPGAEGSDPAGDLGYPVVLAVAHLSPNYPDPNAAANGAYNSAYQQTVDTFIAPVASTVYAIRIDWEWTGKWNIYSPFQGGEDNPTMTPQVFIAGVRNLIAAIKANPKTANIKIEFDYYGTDMEKNYYPGDDVVDLIGFDNYFDPSWDGATSADAWNRVMNGDFGIGYANINNIAAFAKLHNKPMIVPEWGDGYSDGYCITQFAAWMTANNVVGHAYWDADQFGFDPTVPARQQAFVAAFGSTTYAGSYWTLIPVPTNNSLAY